MSPSNTSRNVLVCYQNNVHNQVIGSGSRYVSLSWAYKLYLIRMLLEESHVELLCSTWKHTSPSTHRIISSIIRLKRAFGLFREDRELLAWMMIYSDGSMGMLKTKEAFRKQGLGSFLLKKVTEEALRLGLVPCVHIEEGNTVSRRFFGKFGFEAGDSTQWIMNHDQ